MPTPRTPLHAFIDESGQRSRSAQSSDHFVMSAVIVADEDLPKSASLLGQLRNDLSRRPGDHLTWKNLKQHSQRLHVAKSLGAQEWLTISSVVVCKRHLHHTPTLNDDQSYLYTLRFLLERLSWYARSHGRVLEYTMAHIVRFQTAKLRDYENRLRTNADCQVDWTYLNPRGGRFNQTQTLEALQLADLAASATAAAFNTDTYGNTEERYLREFRQRLYCRPGGQLPSYGLKMHPWGATTKAAYPWVAAL